MTPLVSTPRATHWALALKILTGLFLLVAAAVRIQEAVSGELVDGTALLIISILEAVVGIACLASAACHDR